MSINTEMGLLALRDCNDIFNKLKKTWWITCGTLLGQQREKTFISHDLDLDIAIDIDDFTPEIKTEFIKRGYMLVHTFGTKEAGLELSFRKVNGPKLDIFCMYTHADGSRWNAVWTQAPSNMYRMLTYNYSAFTLKSDKFMDIPIKRPYNVDKYLTEQYGDWRTPCIDWKWYSSPLNLKITDIYSVKDSKSVFGE